MLRRLSQSSLLSLPLFLVELLRSYSRMSLLSVFSASSLITISCLRTVAVSGLKVISYTPFSRRDRIILAAGLSLGFGNLLVPGWSSHIFTYDGPNKALLGFLNSRKLHRSSRSFFCP